MEHDCRLACCSPTVLWQQVQEHQQTEQALKSICHEDNKHFIVNTHALHNMTLLCKFLPHNLTAPTPLYDNCEAKHHEIAAVLWIIQAKKCACTAAKQKATQEAKKKKIQHAVMEKPESEEGEAGDEGGETHDIPSTLEIAKGLGAQKHHCV